jgi:hypothetical protein
VFDDVIDRLFKNQKNFAPEVCAERRVDVAFGRAKFEVDVGGGKNFAGEAAHSLG